MQKPYVCITVHSETIMGLEILEKLFPFSTETLGNVTPEPLNADIVNTPTVCIGEGLRENNKAEIITFPRYRSPAQCPLPPPNTQQQASSQFHGPLDLYLAFQILRRYR
jgi:hypothetical protein